MKQVGFSIGFQSTAQIGKIAIFIFSKGSKYWQSFKISETVETKMCNAKNCEISNYKYMITSEYSCTTSKALCNLFMGLRF